MKMLSNQRKDAYNFVLPQALHPPTQLSLHHCVQTRLGPTALYSTINIEVSTCRHTAASAIKCAEYKQALEFSDLKWLLKIYKS